MTVFPFENFQNVTLVHLPTATSIFLLLEETQNIFLKIYFLKVKAQHPINVKITETPAVIYLVVMVFFLQVLIHYELLYFLFAKTKYICNIRCYCVYLHRQKTL